MSYNEKHLRWKRELCISMSYNEKYGNDKNHTLEHIRLVSFTEKKHLLETGIVYINELQ